MHVFFISFFFHFMMFYSLLTIERGTKCGEQMSSMPVNIIWRTNETNSHQLFIFHLSTLRMVKDMCVCVRASTSSQGQCLFLSTCYVFLQLLLFSWFFSSVKIKLRNKYENGQQLSYPIRYYTKHLSKYCFQFWFVHCMNRKMDVV